MSGLRGRIVMTDHVVMFPDNRTLTCKHCGMNFRLTMPIAAEDFVQYVNSFIEEHKDCEAKNER